MILKLQLDHKFIIKEYENKLNNEIIEKDRTQLELCAAIDQLDFKTQTINRLEQTLLADTTRLEKKLHAQVRDFFLLFLYFYCVYNTVYICIYVYVVFYCVLLL